MLVSLGVLLPIYLAVEEVQKGPELVRSGGGLATLPPVPSGCEFLHFEYVNPLRGPNPYSYSTVGVRRLVVASGRRQYVPFLAHGSLPS